MLISGYGTIHHEPPLARTSPEEDNLLVGKDSERSIVSGRVFSRRRVRHFAAVITPAADSK